MVPVFRLLGGQFVCFVRFSVGSFEFRLVSQSVNLLFFSNFDAPIACQHAGIRTPMEFAVMAVVCALLCCVLAGSEYWLWVSL